MAAGLGALLRLLPAGITRLLPACPIHRAFGLLCPGCGATRAALALAHGQLAVAWQANALFLLALPVLFLYCVSLLRRRALDPQASLSLSPGAPAIAVLLAATVVFAVARNLPR